MSKGTFVRKPIEKYVRDRLPVFDTMLSNLCKSFNNATDLIVQCIKKAYFTCAIFHLSIKNLEAHLKHHLDRFIKKYNNGFNVSDDSINALLNNDKTFPSYISNRARTICYNALVRLFWLTDFILDKKNKEIVSEITEIVINKGVAPITGNDEEFNKLYNDILSDLKITKPNLFSKQMFIVMINLIGNKIANQNKAYHSPVKTTMGFKGNLRINLSGQQIDFSKKQDIIREGKTLLFARAQKGSLHQTIQEFGSFDEDINAVIREKVDFQSGMGSIYSAAKRKNSAIDNSAAHNKEIKAKEFSHEEIIIKKAREGINSKSEIFYLLAEKFYVPTVNLIKKIEKFVAYEFGLLEVIGGVFTNYDIRYKTPNKPSTDDDKNEYLFACVHYDFDKLPGIYGWIFYTYDDSVSEDYGYDEDYENQYQDEIRYIKAYIELLYEAVKTSFGKNEIRAAMYLIFRENYIRYFYEKYVSKINAASFDDYVMVLKEAALREDNLTMWRCYYLYTTKASEGLFKGVSDLEKEAAAKLEEYKIKMARARLLEGAQTIEVRDAVVTNSSKSAYGIKFEKLIAALFEKMEYKVSFTKTTGDYGIDIIADDDIVRIAIQCKCYHGHSVGNDAVQQAVSGKEFYGCDKAMVVTNSTFTPAAIEQAKKSNVILWNRHVLQKMLDAYMPGVRLD